MTMKKNLYHHQTNGGAEYLMDTFNAWEHNGKSGREGTNNRDTRILIRLDGKYPELIHNAAEDDRAELLEHLKNVCDLFPENMEDDGTGRLGFNFRARSTLRLARRVLIARLK
jgi:hypothetical protein